MIHPPVFCSILCIASLFFPLTDSVSTNPLDDSSPAGQDQESPSSSFQPLTNFSTTTVILSSTEFTVDRDNDVDPTCRDEDELTVSGNPDNCGEYFLFCLGPASVEVASQSEAVISGVPSQIKEQYDTRKRSCQDGDLFDGIEKQCMSARNASCNETYETVCQNATMLYKDPIQPSIFIECLVNGTAKRGQCQPLGTIFDEESQTCVKPLPSKDLSPTNPKLTNESNSEPFSFSLLRIAVWIVSSTNEKLSPWMEKIKIRQNLTKDAHLNESFTRVNGDDEDNGETFANLTLTNIRQGENISETDDENDDEEDEILVLTSDTFYLSLYYGVMAGWSILILLTWLGIAYSCSRIWRCCDYDVDLMDDDEDDDLFKYNPYDKYMMTRM